MGEESNSQTPPLKKNAIMQVTESFRIAARNLGKNQISSKLCKIVERLVPIPYTRYHDMQLSEQGGGVWDFEERNRYILQPNKSIAITVNFLWSKNII